VIERTPRPPGVNWQVKPIDGCFLRHDGCFHSKIPLERLHGTRNEEELTQLSSLLTWIHPEDVACHRAAFADDNRVSPPYASPRTRCNRVGYVGYPGLDVPEDGMSLLHGRRYTEENARRSRSVTAMDALRGPAGGGRITKAKLTASTPAWTSCSVGRAQAVDGSLSRYYSPG